MAEEATPQQPLSKSQKKRLRQRQKAKREAEAAAAAAAASEEEPSTEPKKEQPKIQDPLNPHEKLRQDLLTRGYSAEEIDAGMDEMWNLDMQYDELEAVLSYLDGKRALWAQEVQKESAAAAVAVEEVKEPEAEEEEEAVVFVGEEEESSPAPSGKIEEEESGSPVEEQQQQQEESTADAAQQQEEPMAMDLASKLEVVANFENLQDALFALSQWVTKAAKAHELLDLCNANSATGSTPPSPLHIILKRCILFEEDGDDSFSALLPFIHSLLTGLLTVCSGSNNTPPASSGVEDILAIIHFTRETISDSVAVTGHLSAQNDVADSVSRTVTAIIYKNLSVATTTITTSNIFLQPSSTSVQSRIKKFHDEINELVGSSKGGGGGIVELMTDRDCRKLAAEKACDLSQMILHAGSSSDDMGSFRKNRDTALLLSSDEKANLISAIMGEHYSPIQKGVRDFKDIQSRMETLQAELSIKHTEVAAESLTLQSELERVARRKEELKLELEQLERQELLMQKRDAELNVILSNAEGGSDIAYLQSQRDEAMKMVRVDDAVRQLVDKLGQFEISSSPSSPEPVHNGESGFEEIPKDAMESNFDLMMLQMKNYFQAEAAAVNFLEKRVLSLQGEYKDLQRETAQFTALGLTTNVSKMNQSLEEISRNISDDQTVLSALRSESEKMQNIFIDRIQDYVSAMKTSISSNHDAILADVVKSMSIIGINSAPTSIFSQQNGGSGVGALNLTSSPVVVETGGARIPPKQPVGATGAVAPIMPSKAAAPASRVVQQKAAPVEPPKPRLGWAVRNGTGPVKKKEVKSLLDIQKEEMSAKMS